MNGAQQRTATIALGLVLAMTFPGRAQAIEAAVRQVRDDVGWIAGVPSRVVGTEGHAHVVARLEEQLRSLPGVKVWRHPFRTNVPSVEQATLTITDGEHAGIHPVHPLWPAGSRLNTTPAEGLSGRLLYVGQGDFADLPVSSLQGQIAVMESTGGSTWRTLFALGVQAVLLLGSEHETFRDFESHILPIPLNFPRFYLPPGPLAEALRNGKRGHIKGKLVCRSSWQEVTATNLYALVRPHNMSDPLQALAVAVPLDAMSVVLGKAPGADAAVDTASALACLRSLSARPPEHPVLFAFLDAYAIQQLGMRQLLMTLGSLPDLAEELQKPQLATCREYREHETLAVAMEQESDPLNAFHQALYRPLRDYVKQEVQKEVLAIDARLEPLRLAQFRFDGTVAEKEQLEARLEALQQERNRYYAAQRLLLQSALVTESIRPRAQVLWDRARARIRAQLEFAEQILDEDARRAELRQEVLAALGYDRSPDPPIRPLSFLLGLDLSDASVAVGPSLIDDFLGWNETRNSVDFTRWLQVLAKERAAEVWPPSLRRVINLAPTLGLDAEEGQETETTAKKRSRKPAQQEADDTAPHVVNLSPLRGTESPASYRVSTAVNPTGPAASFGLPAMTWATLDGLRTRVDTPQDRPERLDWKRIDPQVAATLALIDAWARDPAFAPRPTTALTHVLRLHGYVMDQAPGEPVARVPMSDYLAVLLPGRANHVQEFPPCPGVRRLEFVRTGADGGFLFDALPADTGWPGRLQSLQAYLFDEDGRIIRTVNNQQSGKGVRLDVDRRWRRAQPLRAVVFSCKEYSTSDLFDPRFLMPLQQISILDARRGVPKRLNHQLYQGMLAFFMEHGARWQLLLRAGIVGNRMVLVNALRPDKAAGMSVRDSLLGYSKGTDLPAHPFLASARDFYHLDARRLADYRRAGIANQAIERIQALTRDELEQAEAAYEADDGVKFFRYAMGALANEVRSYQAVRRTADDVIRGAIFLLLVLLPFSYAMERLLFASAHVYRQIAGGVAIFSVMTAILWSFHPAFRMSSMPMMIIMAFGVLFMSLLVILMIFGKFESELEKMRSGKAESSSAKTSRLGLVSTATRLGIANMRKRKLRTALTGMTIVLITFALLCFMSATTYVEKSEYSVDAQARTPAVLIRQPGERTLPAESLPFLQNLVGDRVPIIPRYWWCNSADPQWRLHLRNPMTGQQVSLPAAVGLVPDEPLVSGIDRVCPDWEQFQHGDGCYLATRTAESLGVKPGDTLVVAGQSLRLIGVFDELRFNREIRRLDGKSLLPPDYSMMDDQERQLKSRHDIQTVMLELSSGMAGDEMAGAPPLSGDQVVILPANLLVGMKNSSLRSMAMPASSADEARALAMDLSTKLAFPIYFGSPEGVRVVAATPLSPKAPKSLLIPLLIAGMIIFNTMLSSLAERKGEIYIYTSLGLAPLHIGVLFLAEALTYGMLGSICGYVIGQGLASVFSALGWMGGITLNFGGTQAVVTMLLVLAVVFVSSLVPAYLAGKVATPSNEMRWTVPEPVLEDGLYVIREVLPFTATARTAPGIGAFLYDYFDAHLDGAIGHFTAGDLQAVVPEGAGASGVGVRATVWLAPYDLSVRQDLLLTVRALPDDEDLYEIAVQLTHGAGQIRNWHRLNRTFLGNLRRQLLGWRKLTNVRVLDYIRKGRGTLFVSLPANAT